MPRVRCSCSKCEFNNNSECQADDVEFKSSRDDDGRGVSCDTFRVRRNV